MKMWMYNTYTIMQWLRAALDLLKLDLQLDYNYIIFYINSILGALSGSSHPA